MVAPFLPFHIIIPYLRGENDYWASNKSPKAKELKVFYAEVGDF
jgi:hypothetical protein